MAKRKKAAKPRHRRPPLSWMDKVLYWVLLTLWLAAAFSCCVLFDLWQQRIGAANGAIAVEETASVLLLLVPLLPAVIAGIILFDIGYNGRIPLLPSRKKDTSSSRKQQSTAWRGAVVAAVALWLASFLPAVGAVYCRVEIHETHMDTYGMFGRFKEHRSLEEATSVGVSIYYGASGRYTRSWRMSYTIHFEDGESVSFQKRPSILLEMDRLFPDIPKTVEGAAHLGRLCEEYHCTPEEREGLRRLLQMDDGT